MRIRHAMAAGSAVALLSAATSLMASASASAQATVQLAAPAPAAMGATTSAGSSAGLVLGLLAVIGIAAVSFVVRLSTVRSSPKSRRVITIPEAAFVLQRVPAYAE
ncbi:MAG: hypothetical protein ABIM89_11580 [Mycobacteriales bacterium]